MQLHDGRPKQKRHRCRNPNKLDVNSLTGEERVQLINRRNARKVLTLLFPFQCSSNEKLPEKNNSVILHLLKYCVQTKGFWFKALA